MIERSVRSLMIRLSVKYLMIGLSRIYYISKTKVFFFFFNFDDLKQLHKMLLTNACSLSGATVNLFASL